VTLLTEKDQKRPPKKRFQGKIQVVRQNQASKIYFNSIAMPVYETSGLYLSHFPGLAIDGNK